MNQYRYVTNALEADLAFTLQPNNRWTLTKNRDGCLMSDLTDQDLRTLCAKMHKRLGCTVRVFKQSRAAGSRS